MRVLLPLLLVFLTRASFAAGFDGHWRSDDPCAADGYGSHNSVMLREANANNYVGTWEESTNDRGWGGQIKGYEKNGKLTLFRCIDPESSSWSVEKLESCPHFKQIGSFALSGNKLFRISKSTVWPLAEVFIKSPSPKGERLQKLYECSMQKNE